MARRFQSRTRRGPRRLTDWIGGVQTVPVNENTLNGQTAAFLTSFDTRTIASPAAPFTLIRQRGLIVITPQAISIEQFVLAAYGICVINGEAFDAGVASSISPWSEAGDDRWLYHTYLSTQNKVGGTVDNAGYAAQMLPDYHVINGMGQRKVEFGDVIVMILENGSTDNLTFMHNVRMLVKLY